MIGFSGQLFANIDEVVAIIRGASSPSDARGKSY